MILFYFSNSLCPIHCVDFNMKAGHNNRDTHYNSRQKLVENIQYNKCRKLPMFKIESLVKI